MRGHSQEAGAPVKGGSLSYGEKPGIGSLDPYQSTNSTAPTDRALSMIYEPLYRYNFLIADGWESVLAVGEPVAAVPQKGGKAAFAVNLRPGVLWHDGTPFTAADVIHTYNYIRWAGYNKMVREDQAKRMVDVRQGSGPLQVVFEFAGLETEPRYRMLEFIVPQSRFRHPPTYVTAAAQAAGFWDPVSPDKSLNSKPIGTGPYRRDTTEYGLPQLSAFPKYHGTPVNIQRIGGREFTDQSQMVAGFLTAGGDIQMIVEVPPKFYPQIEKSGIAFPGKVPAYNALAIVLRQKPNSVLNDARVRRAMTMAVNREQLLTTWFGGKGEVLASPMSSYSPYYNANVRPLPHDSERASSELRAAAVPRGTRLSFVYPNIESASDTHLSDMVQSIKESLQKVGFVIDLVPKPPGFYEQMLLGERGDFDLALVRWEFNPAYDITPLFTTSTIGAGGRNSSRYSDPVFDRLARDYQETEQEARRLKLSYQIQEHLNQAAPAIFLLSEDKVYAYHMRYTIPPNSVDPFNFFTYVGLWWFNPR